MLKRLVCTTANGPSTKSRKRRIDLSRNCSRRVIMARPPDEPAPRERLESRVHQTAGSIAGRGGQQQSCSRCAPRLSAHVRKQALTSLWEGRIYAECTDGCSDAEDRDRRHHHAPRERVGLHTVKSPQVYPDDYRTFLGILDGVEP